ncbi:transglycosylase domain-containing protein [Ancylobacter oerskovii]|uniref:peptidoglycan glycosyltransferase n=1 Tax=Ancylobacter oerskovii TaxID=459519 RepID=A0ABW4YWL5_9HYPH|nr:penicillin-binding protein 1A [Ancylobacter oerskovii]MBS7542312.1 penicillin-binding protein 1A [Ancylobacter oerskovii]
MVQRNGRMERREPVLGASAAMTAHGDMRLSPEDRPTTMARNGGGSSRKSGAGASDGKRTGTRSSSGRGGGRKPRRGLLSRLFYWSFVLGIWGVVGVAGLIFYEASQLPPIQNLAIPERPPTIIIQAADGKTIATRGEMRGSAVPLRSLPPFVPQAFVAIEDRRFYSHFGIDPMGLARALVTNLTSGRLREGGSTLTQQLAKNLFLTQERTLSRKIQELILSIWLETKYSKNEILELYVNRVYFGAGAWGIEAAAQRYFNKPARQLTLAEAAMIAGLVKSPSSLAPTRNLEAAQQRASVVLDAMVDARFISPDMEQAALAKPATVAKNNSSDVAGYVADWVADQLKTILPSIEHDVIVQTTLDMSLQAVADKALKDALARNGKKLGVEQGAMVIMDTEGGVRALVGGRSYEESQYNRAVTARRQPGSSFKPFVYLTALETGMSPASVREDAPVQIKGWKPENFSRDYRGPVDLTTAIALSLNTVAVRLALEVGPAAVISTAQRLGISSKLEPNASIALGTSEVSVLEMADAYVPFANGGFGVAPHVISQVKDSASGKLLYTAPSAERGSVIAPPHLAMIDRMLRQVVLTGTAKRVDLPGWQVAGKTGTSQDYRDAWFIGFTGKLVGAVWIGNDDSSPTKKASGSGVPVEIWSQVMKAAHKDMSPVPLPGAGTETPPAAAPPGLPPGEVPEDPVVTGGPQAQRKPATIDNWLLDKLFGG